MIKRSSNTICALFLAFVLVVGLCPFSGVQAFAQPSAQIPSQTLSVEDQAPNATSDSSGADAAQSNPEALPKSEKVDESEEGTAYAAGEVLVTMKDAAESVVATETLQQAQTVKTDTVTEENVVSEDTLLAEVADGATVAQAIAELEADPQVEAVQPNYYYTLMDDDSAEATAAAVTQQSIAQIAPESSVETNDPLAVRQWGIKSAHVDEAWSLAKCNGSVGVAVLDTGVKADHPDLQANLYGATCTTTNETDSTVNDNNGHGTHVCGIVSAAVNNIGVAGISYNAKVVPVRVFKVNGSCSTSDIIKGFTYVIDNKDTYNIRVINLSLGGVGSYSASSSSDIAFKNAIITAYDAGILTVCASGNAANYTVNGVTSYYSAPFDCWPGNFDEAIGKDTILTVGNSDSTPARASSSNYGPTLDVMAPGTFILSTTTSYSSTYGGYYGIKSGTSMATPFVSACAALCFAAKPNATVDEVRTCLEKTATDLGVAGKDDETGYGEVNAYAAVVSMLGIDIQGADHAEVGIAESYSLTSTDVTDVTWSVNDASKATIDAITGVLVPLSAGTITVTAKSGSYSWSKEVAISESSAKTIPIEKVTVSSIPAFTYSGNQCRPAPTVFYEGKQLTEGISYTLSYANNVNAGVDTATVIITGAGDFVGTKPVSFTINPKSITSPTAKTGLSYTGLSQTGVEAADAYTVANGAATNAGTYKAKVTLKDTNNTSWEDGTTADVEVAYSIAKASLAAAYAGETITLGATPALKVNVTGFVNNESAATAAGYVAPTVTAPSPQTVGTVSLTPANGAANNYTFTYTAGNLTINKPSDTTMFDDVNKEIEDQGGAANVWYVNDGWLDYVVTNGLMSGYAGTKNFGPYDNITRGQVAVILYRYSGETSYGSTTDSAGYASDTVFKDEAAKVYYTAAINWAKDAKVMTGDAATGYTTVRPDDPVTREELCLMLYRFADSKGAGAKGTVDGSGILGMDSVSDWARVGVDWAVSRGVIGGVNNGNGTYSMKPQDTTWRSSMAKMITVTTRDVLKGIPV